jgi:UDPglucose 6-dehydrogenase
MRIGIVGKGVVGSAVYDGLRQIGHDLKFYDTAYPDTALTDLTDSDIIYVCVPTDQLPDGSCDVSTVSDTVAKLAELNYSGVIAVKSTVIPGTTEKLIVQYPTLSICFVPEFLRERSALTDFIDHHDILIVGTDDTAVYDFIVACHGNIPKKVIQVSPTEAEIAKYFSNVFNALRITFANGVFEVCEQLGADYQKVFQAATHRHNITADYLRCSQYLRGFGGHCLPKDSKAWAVLVEQLGLDIKLFQALVEDNQRYIR